MHISYKPEVRVLKDRRFRVFVDCDDAVGILHARNVLKGPADTHCKINLRFHRLSGGTYLSRLGQPCLVDDAFKRPASSS
jgi:hypothetical protein